MPSLNSILENTATYIILYPFIVGIVNRSKFLNDLTTFFWYIIFSTCCEVTIFCTHFLGINNLFVVHIYITGSVIFLSFYYWSIMRELMHRVWPYIISIVFTILAALNAIFLQHLNSFPTYTIMLASVVIVSLILSSMYERSLRTSPRKLINIVTLARNRGTHFFINAGLIIYYVGCVPVFIAVNMAIEQNLNNLALDLWSIHHCLVIIMYFFIGTGLLKHKSVELEPYSNDAFAKKDSSTNL